MRWFCWTDCFYVMSVMYSSFQTFTMFWMLYAFFWVFHRCLNFISRHFGALSVPASYLPAYEVGTDTVPKRRHVKFRCWGIAQKKTYNSSVVVPALSYTTRSVFCIGNNMSVHLMKQCLFALSLHQKISLVSCQDMRLAMLICMTMW